MGSIAFNIPNNYATFRYSFRATGGAWPADALMVGGNKDSLAPFTSPVCDELRITATYTSSFVFTLAHLAKLSITSGLTIEVLAGVGSVSTLTTTAQTVPAIPVVRHDQNFAIASVTADQVQVIITGIGAAQLDVGQIVFCDNSWTRTNNYNDGASRRVGNRYARAESLGAAKQTITGRLRGHNVDFSLATDAEYKDLSYKIDRLTKDGLVVYQKDVSSALVEDSYLANIMIADANITEVSTDISTFSVDIIEAIG